MLVYTKQNNVLMIFLNILKKTVTKLTVILICVIFGNYLRVSIFLKHMTAIQAELKIKNIKNH